jgi:hypothetical protein
VATRLQITHLFSPAGWPRSRSSDVRRLLGPVSQRSGRLGGTNEPLGELRRADRPLRLSSAMRDLETIDSELRLLAAVRPSIREHGGEPSSRQVDKLLDERLGHLRRAGEDAAVDV